MQILSTDSYMYHILLFCLPEKYFSKSSAIFGRSLESTFRQRLMISLRSPLRWSGMTTLSSILSSCLFLTLKLLTPGQGVSPVTMYATT